MLNKRLIVILAATALLVVAAVRIQTGAVVSAVGPTGADLSDYYQRHPGLTIAMETVPSDELQQNPEILIAGNAVAVSDYFQRHPELLKPGNTVDLSDWFQRHSDSLKLGNAVDLSDWSLRHPESIIR